MTPGSYETAALWNANVYNGLSFVLNPPVFVAYQSAVQSIPNSSITTIGMDTTVIDTYAGHSNVTNNNRYTPTVAGWYLVVASIGFAANATGGRDLEIRKNGSTVNLGQSANQAADASITTTIRAVAPVLCNGTTDYIDMFGYQTCGSSLNTNPGQTGMFVFWMHA
ncbi:hypothetical protein [Kitasatospora sp. NPDC056531]|uniref:hypothetical protein n=1 Tax=Kitasatospora sp. NPDC056531 TaxID=3345856 RepID=UPI003693F4D4